MRRTQKQKKIRERALLRVKMQDISLSVRQAAKKFHVSPTTVQKWRARGSANDLRHTQIFHYHALSDDEKVLIRFFHDNFQLTRTATFEALLPLFPNLKFATLRRLLSGLHPTKRKTSKYKDYPYSIRRRRPNDIEDNDDDTYLNDDDEIDLPDTSVPGRDEW